MDHSPGFLALVADAKSRVRETTPEEVQRRRQAGERFHLVDVREDREWREDEQGMTEPPVIGEVLDVAAVIDVDVEVGQRAQHRAGQERLATMTARRADAGDTRTKNCLGQ